jgi:hypothetical protein
MPTISIFFGIMIRMFFPDIEKHKKPHLHADYQGQVAVYSIEDGSVLAGNLPPNKHKLVVAWIEIHCETIMRSNASGVQAISSNGNAGRICRQTHLKPDGY